MIDIMSGLMLASAYPQESGLMHSKQSGRYEVVKALPKESSSFDQMFDYADAEGNIRMAYIFNSSKDNSVLAIGGTFGFNTAAYRGISLHVKATTSQNIGTFNDNAVSGKLTYDFFDAEGNSFTYLSHTNIHYVNNALDIIVGHILLDTPYADSDDIRMAANTFEGVHFKYALNDELELTSYYLTRWAGYDSGDNQDQFKTLVDDGFGMIGASLNYKFDEENMASLWYYYADVMSSIIYAEYSGHYNISNDFHIEYGIQGSSMSELENSGVNGLVLGVMAILDYGPMFCGFAYDRGFIDTNEAITDGFGGGPYYTSLDEATIGAVSQNAVGDDVMAYRIGLGYEFEAIGLVIEGVFGNLRSRHNTVNIKESDLIVTYAINDRLSLEGTIMSYNSDTSSDDFERGILRIEYNF